MNSNLPAVQKVIWGDLVVGKPELEDSLSTNAKVMKADMYWLNEKNEKLLCKGQHTCTGTIDNSVFGESENYFRNPYYIRQ